MNFSESILSDKPYLGAEVGGNGVCVCGSGRGGRVREVENSILEMSRKLWL